MESIQWHNALCIGIDRIDIHNKALVQHLDSLLVAITSEPFSREMNERFLDFLDYAVFHFACEEIWMSHPRYALIAEHHAAHTKLFDKFRDVHAALMQGEHTPITEISALAQSVMSHIKEKDKEYARWCAEALN